MPWMRVQGYLQPSEQRHVSFEYKPELKSAFEESDLPGLATNKKYKEKPKRENLKLSPRALRYLKDQTEEVYAKPLHFLQSWPRNLYKRSPESSVLCTTLVSQSNADQNERRAKKSIYSTDHSADSIEKRRKYHLLVKEKESARDNQARTPCPVKQNVLIPLNLEAVMKNPTVKIIDLGPTERVLYFMDMETVPTTTGRPDTKPIPSSSLDFPALKAEESHTNPIIFHDTAYVEMLFLAKRFTPYVMTYTRKNVVLEKNCEMTKALFNDQPYAVSNPQRPKPVLQHKELFLLFAQLVQQRLQEKRKKKLDRLASENRLPNTLYNLSRTFSSITKKFVGYFDKDAIQEKNATTDEFGRIFSKTKPPPTCKFTALPLKYDSKPLKNITEIRKLNNITPLDSLLS
ncbi:uncharacterized protein C1orf141 homolog isoform X2 [Mesocricetus auratus]|uniref:Uncharacterized protein C1orf141 homolog isoform X2 n=1 Tax=Mesocricetus auratus TaxID=10036 RepID=A0ABM2YEZ9_MESAU|nr:uncharacterized protein C1orf141 homolog isoform X2 [Mesocricetus auratus]